MAKKLHQHTIHWSDEVEALARANMKTTETLNAYIERVVKDHDRLLKACAYADTVATYWPKLQQILREDAEGRMGGR